MCARKKDGRDPDSGNTARGDDAQDDKTVESNSSSKSDPELIRGRVLDDKYEIISHLGSGAMGAVYKARHKVLNKEVAIKVLQSANLDDEVKKKRFMREARAQGGLTHKNIAAVHDVGLTEEDQPFFVMDLLTGESLEEHLEKQKSLDCDVFINIFEQVARGLQHAHSKSIVHRDIKPSNIMLIESEDGDLLALVVDFGIAVIDESDVSKLTREGYIVGTPHYMSPEQIEGKKLDARSDVYSLGCVMFEALTGNPPFQGINAPATMALHIAQKPEHISSFKTKSPLPAELADLVMRCIEKDPDKRLATAKEVSAQLNSIKAASSESAKGKQKSIPKAEAEDELVGAGKGHRSNPAHAPSVPEVQSDNQQKPAIPEEKSADKLADVKVADKIELKVGESAEKNADKAKISNEQNKVSKDHSTDSIEQSKVSLEIDDSSDSSDDLAHEAERVKSHIPSGSSTGFESKPTAVYSSSKVDEEPFIHGHDIIRLITGLVVAAIFWPMGGRLVLPISAADMRDDNLFFMLAKFLVDMYNHWASHIVFQFLILGVIIVLIDRVACKLLKHGPND
ncbi:MAG: hypothetical protein C0469_03735 [Cyanobacteria bacterium DS2.3.42]|nr:hypothetical protein [Cyanobacteria bacterium DS2.3.42]